MPFCTKCGSDNIITAKFCSKCGKVLNYTNPSKEDKIAPAINEVDQTILKVDQQNNPLSISKTNLLFEVVDEDHPTAKKNKRKLFAVIALVVLVVGGFATWFFLVKDKKDETVSVVSTSVTDSVLRSNSADSQFQADKNLKPDLTLANETPQSSATLLSGMEGSYSVTTKSYFFESPDYSTIRKGYLLKGNEFVVNQAEGEFAYGSFTNTAGKITSGWILLSDLEKQPETKFKMPKDVISRDNQSFSFYSDKSFAELKSIFIKLCNADGFNAENDTISGYTKGGIFIQVSKTSKGWKIDYSCEADECY